MTKRLSWAGAGLGLFAALALFAAGCGEAKDKGKTPPAKSGHAAGDGHDHSKEVAKSDNKHGGWWCDEHGIPEEECSMCSAKVAKEAKAKGDWCDKHDRAKSQCFICDPTLKEKFAAKYRAKYGKEPPPIEEEGKEKDKGKADNKK